MEGAGIDDLTASIWTPPPQMLEQCSGPLEPDKSHQSLEELYEQFLLDDRHSSQNAEDISSDDGDVHHGPDPLLDSLRPGTRSTASLYLSSCLCSSWIRNNLTLFVDMDMATAIQSVDPNPRCFETLEPVQTLQEVSYTEPLNLVPDFYAYAVKACLLPIRRVQHELFTGYFRHVHPMFPVVDEHHFHEKHRQFMGREELLHPSDFMIYQAILAAGFGVS